MEDAELFEAWRGGDAAAGNRLFARHFDAVARFFEGRVEDVEDLVQATFMACAHARQRLTPQTRFRAYVFGVAYRQLSRYYRDRGRRRPTALLRSVAAPLATPSRELSRRRSGSALESALADLPRPVRLTVELYFWEDLTASEIAEVMRTPEGTVRTRLRRGRALLRRRLDASEGGHCTVRRIG